MDSKTIRNLAGGALAVFCVVILIFALRPLLGGVSHRTTVQWSKKRYVGYEPYRRGKMRVSNRLIAKRLPAKLVNSSKYDTYVWVVETTGSQRVGLGYEVYVFDCPQEALVAHMSFRGGSRPMAKVLAWLSGLPESKPDESYFTTEEIVKMSDEKLVTLESELIVEDDGSTPLGTLRLFLNQGRTSILKVVLRRPENDVGKLKPDLLELLDLDKYSESLPEDRRIVIFDKKTVHRDLLAIAAKYPSVFSTSERAAISMKALDIVATDTREVVNRAIRLLPGGDSNVVPKLISKLLFDENRFTAAKGLAANVSPDSVDPETAQTLVRLLERLEAAASPKSRSLGPNYDLAGFRSRATDKADAAVTKRDWRLHRIPISAIYNGVVVSPNGVLVARKNNTEATIWCSLSGKAISMISPTKFDRLHFGDELDRCYAVSTYWDLRTGQEVQLEPKEKRTPPPRTYTPFASHKNSRSGLQSEAPGSATEDAIIARARIGNTVILTTERGKMIVATDSAGEFVLREFDLPGVPRFACGDNAGPGLAVDTSDALYVLVDHSRFSIDWAPPEVHVAQVDTGTMLAGTPLQLNATSSSAMPGVHTEYRWNEGEWVGHSGAPVVAPAATANLQVRAVDMAGQISEIWEQQIALLQWTVIRELKLGTADAPWATMEAGSKIVSADEEQVVSLEVASGALQPLFAVDEPANLLYVSPGDRYIVAAGETLITIFDRDSQKVVYADDPRHLIPPEERKRTARALKPLLAPRPYAIAINTALDRFVVLGRDQQGHPTSHFIPFTNSRFVAPKETAESEGVFELNSDDGAGRLVAQLITLTGNDLFVGADDAKSIFLLRDDLRGAADGAERSEFDESLQSVTMQHSTDGATIVALDRNETSTNLFVHQFTDDAKISSRQLIQEETVVDFSLAPAGDVLVVASGDGTASIVNLSDGSIRSKIESQSSIIRVTFVANGRGVATRYQDGATKIWALRRAATSAK
jgi:hypothetical protein